MVLFVLFMGKGETKIGVAAQRSTGSAVKRNRVRRRLRALVQTYDDRLVPCGHIVVLGKSSVVSASWATLQRSFERLMVKSKCLKS